LDDSTQPWLSHQLANPPGARRGGALHQTQSLAQLQGISGLGVKKLEAYDEQVLRVCNGAA